MRLSNPKTIIAYLIVGTYVCLTVIAVIYPVLGIWLFDMEKFSAYFSKISGALTGLVGVIVGYYFAKNENNPPDNDNSTGISGSSNSPTSPPPTDKIPLAETGTAQPNNFPPNDYSKPD